MKKLVFCFLIFIFSLAFNFVLPISAEAIDSTTKNYGLGKINIFTVVLVEVYGANMISQGSATLISNNGYAITNAHVVDVDNIESIAVCVTKNPYEEDVYCSYKADIVAIDKDRDLALLKIADAKKLPCTSINDDYQPQIGSKISVLGFPAIGGRTINVTKGTISGYSQGNIKSDVKTTHGNSGGAGFVNNKWVGIPTFITQDEGGQISWLIPRKKVKAFLKSNNINLSCNQSILSFKFDIFDVTSKNTFTKEYLSVYEKWTRLLEEFNVSHDLNKYEQASNLMKTFADNHPEHGQANVAVALEYLVYVNEAVRAMKEESKKFADYATTEAYQYVCLGKRWKKNYNDKIPDFCLLYIDDMLSNAEERIEKSDKAIYYAKRVLTSNWTTLGKNNAQQMIPLLTQFKDDAVTQRNALIIFKNDLL